MSRVKILPEAEFLIRCCRADASEDWEALLERAEAVRDWDSVVSLSVANGIAPVVLPVFKALAASGIVPDNALTDLRAAAILDVARVVRLRSALRGMLPALHESGLRVILLKGVGLASLIYDDPNVRPSRDIDLLCREEDFAETRNLLVSLGYNSDAPAALPRLHTEHESHLDRHFFHPDGLVHVEVHLDSIKLGVRARHLESMWTRALPIELEEGPVLIPAPADQFLMLSVHLHRHGFNRLIWFKDIDLLVRRYGPELDWKQIVTEARREGAGASVWYTIHFLRQAFGTPVPHQLDSELKPSLLVRRIFSRIWPDSRVLNLQARTKRRAVQFAVAESWRGIVPSLLLMGRRRDKVSILIRRLLSF